jgi:hypothetical protein
MINWILRRGLKKSLILSSKFKPNSSIKEKTQEFRLSFLLQWKALILQSMELSLKRQKLFSQSSKTTLKLLKTNLPY